MSQPRRNQSSNPSKRCRTYKSERFPRRSAMLWLGVLLIQLAFVSVANADDEDILRELLKEQERLEEERIRENSHQYDDDYINNQEQERLHSEQLLREENAAAQERVIHAERERIRQQREIEFESYLARLNDQEKKLALKKKKKDSRTVNVILKAFANQNYYAVLGLRCFDVTFGPIQLFSYQLGPYTLFRPDSKDIKKAYRGRAMMTHPDKNKDGRAHEAFVAVEESASILSDARMRSEYDSLRKTLRLEQQARIMETIQKAVVLMHQQVSRLIWIFRNLFGPFATPIFIIGCLIL